jgi:hypothetical protein
MVGGEGFEKIHVGDGVFESAFGHGHEVMNGEEVEGGEGHLAVAEKRKIPTRVPTRHPMGSIIL